jgi:glutamate-1-semialdehyde aminotransferase
MNREQFIRKLRAHCRKNGLLLDIDEVKGKGSHYLVTVGAARTVVASKLTPHRIDNILKQLSINPREFR